MKHYVFMAVTFLLSGHLFAQSISLPANNHSISGKNANHSTLLSSKNSSQKLFRCDGRTYCSQMTSCEEATFFLKNCPNPKMDGNNDGIPCEKQWCN